MGVLRNIETKTIYLERRWRDWFTQVVSCLLLKKPLPVSAPISKNGCKPHPRSTILSQNISYSATPLHTIPNSAKLRLQILCFFTKLSCSLYSFQFKCTMPTPPQQLDRQTLSYQCHQDSTGKLYDDIVCNILSRSVEVVRTTQCCKIIQFSQSDRFPIDFG